MLETAADFAQIQIARAEIWFLVLMRISFFVFTIPFFSNQIITPRLKAGFCGVFSILLIPTLDLHPITFTPGVPSFVYLVFQECLVGAIMGFTFSFMISFVDLAAESMTRDIGLSTNPAQDPITGEESSQMGQFLLILFGLIFLLNNGHFYFLQALAQSFHYIPLNEFSWNFEKLVFVWLNLLSQAMITGIQMAFPIMAMLIVTSLGMALMNKVMPNMNVWVVSVPIKIVAGTLVLIYLLPAMVEVFWGYFQKVQAAILIVMRVGGPNG
jgi:flagellar biosynthetic protein FliR